MQFAALYPTIFNCDKSWSRVLPPPPHLSSYEQSFLRISSSTLCCDKYYMYLFASTSKHANTGWRHGAGVLLAATYYTRFYVVYHMRVATQVLDLAYIPERATNVCNSIYPRSFVVFQRSLMAPQLKQQWATMLIYSSPRQLYEMRVDRDEYELPGCLLDRRPGLPRGIRISDKRTM